MKKKQTGKSYQRTVNRGEKKCKDWKDFKMAAKIKMADVVLMQSCIRGYTVYIPEKFGVDGKLYVEVMEP